MPKHPLHALLPQQRGGKDVSTVLLLSLTVRRMFSLLDYLGILARLFPVVNKYLQNFFDIKRLKPPHIFCRGGYPIRPYSGVRNDPGCINCAMAGYNLQEPDPCSGDIRKGGAHLQRNPMLRNEA